MFEDSALLSQVNRILEASYFRQQFFRMTYLGIGYDALLHQHAFGDVGENMYLLVLPHGSKAGYP